MGEKLEKLSKDEVEIKAVFERWVKAVRDKNTPRMPAVRDSEMPLFDAPPALFSRRQHAFSPPWQVSWSDKLITFDFHDVKVTAKKDLAFATAKGRCAGRDPSGNREKLEFRLTMGFRKINGSWRLMREHHSLPADMGWEQYPVAGGLET